MRRIALSILLVLGMVLVGGPVSGQAKKTKPKDTKDIRGTGAKEKDTKDLKDVKKDPAGKYPTEIAGKDLEGWVKSIRDPDPSVRQIAIRTVGHFGPPARKKAVPNLITALRETDVGLKSDAATALGMIGMEDVDMAKGIGALIVLLGDQQRGRPGPCGQLAWPVRLSRQVGRSQPVRLPGAPGFLCLGSSQGVCLRAGPRRL